MESTLQWICAENEWVPFWLILYSSTEFGEIHSVVF